MAQADDLPARSQRLFDQRKYTEAAALVEEPLQKCKDVSSAYCTDVRIAYVESTYFLDWQRADSLLTIVTGDLAEKDYYRQAYVNYLDANVNIQRGSMGEVVNKFEEAIRVLSLSEQPDHRLTSKCYADLAMQAVYNKKVTVDPFQLTDQAIEVAKESGRTSLLIETTMVRAIVEAMRGSAELAEQGFLKTIEMAEQDTSEHYQLGGLNHNMANFLHIKGQDERALPYAEKAIVLARQHEPEGVRFAIFLKAAILQELGQQQPIIELVNESISHYGEDAFTERDGLLFFREDGENINLGIAMQLYSMRAEALAASGDTTRALEDYRSELATRDLLRRRSKTEQGRHYWSRQHSKTYDQALELLLARNRPADRWEALFFSDRVRGAALLNEYTAHYDTTAVPDYPTDSTYWQALTATHQGHLLAYHLGAGIQLRFHLSPAGQLTVDRLPPPDTSSLDVMVKEWKEVIQASAFRSKSLRTTAEQSTLDSTFLQRGRELARYLLPSKMGPGDLLIVADGPLHYLPFAALPLTEGDLPLDYRRLRYLSTGREVHFTHSLGHYAALSDDNAKGQQHPFDLLAFAPSFGRGSIPSATTRSRTSLSPDEALAPLAHSREEVETIAAFIPSATSLTNAEAKLERFRQDAPDSKVLHLSSHSMVDPVDPNRSFIAFYQEGDSLQEEELLFYNELSELSLPCELVVLSACETSLGPIAPGEGVLSIGSAFTAAGARSTLSSRWKVDDEATKELMVAFYRRLAEGQSRVAALTGAREELRKSEAYAHPYYWAGMALHGAAGPVTFGRSWWYRAWPWMLGAIVILSFGVMRLKVKSI